MSELRNELIDKIASINKQELDRFFKQSIKETIHKYCDLSFSEFSIMSRVKSTESALEKLKRKGYTSVNDMSDLIGVKVVANAPSDLLKIKEILESNYKVLEVNDYILKPHDNGYVGLHMDLSIDGYSIECQIKTVAMNKAQDITHDHVYKSELEPELVVALNKTIFSHYTNDDVSAYRTLVKSDLKKKYEEFGKRLEINEDGVLKKQFNEIGDSLNKIDMLEKERINTKNPNIAEALKKINYLKDVGPSLWVCKNYRNKCFNYWVFGIANYYEYSDFSVANDDW